MVILITGASHTGKTLTAQRLLEKYHYPYLSVDHLKMGLIRSGNTNLTPNDDEKLCDYLWKIVRETVKTAIENCQNLIVEGCYIPLDWEKDFDENYLENIRLYCLVMSRAYIERNFSKVIEYENAIEHRQSGGFTKGFAIAENAKYAELCKKYGQNVIRIDDGFPVDIDL